MGRDSVLTLSRIHSRSSSLGRVVVVVVEEAPAAAAAAGSACLSAAFLAMVEECGVCLSGVAGVVVADGQLGRGAGLPAGCERREERRGNRGSSSGRPR